MTTTDADPILRRMTRSDCEEDPEDLPPLTEADLEQIERELAEDKILIQETRAALARWQEAERLAQAAREREIRIVIPRGWWRSPVVLSVRDL